MTLTSGEHIKQSGTRQIWMFPRNKRRVVALETAIMLRALVIASEKGTTWSGDQAQQNKFSKILEDLGLKAGGNQIDKNSGGPRTYISQFQCLGLVSKVGKSEIRLTQSGEDMAHFDQPGDALRWQVLKMQYPSEYSIATAVRIDPSIKIRPALFLIELASDPEIAGLSDKDIMVPVVFGKTHNSFLECKNKILKARKDGIESVIDNPNLLKTARTKVRTVSERMTDLKDVANTFANLLIGSGLCQRIQVDETSRIVIREQYKAIFDEVKNLPIVNFQKNNQLQDSLKIGNRRGALKDTRRIFMPSGDLKLQGTKEFILNKFYEVASFPISQLEIDSFAKKMQREFGVDYKFVLESIDIILKNSSQYINSQLIDLSQGGTKGAISFENAIVRVFKDDFGYEAEGIGQRKRKGVGGYSDVFIVENERGKCGIIDAKAIRNYDLPHQDMTKMLQTYIPSASELFPSGRTLELSFVGYVSHLISSGAHIRANEIYQKSGLPVVLCSVYGLNNLRENPAYFKQPPKITDLFTSAKVVQINL
jgi:hypothetical protein